MGTFDYNATEHALRRIAGDSGADTDTTTSNNRSANDPKEKRNKPDEADVRKKSPRDTSTDEPRHAPSFNIHRRPSSDGSRNSDETGRANHEGGGPEHCVSVAGQSCTDSCLENSLTHRRNSQAETGEHHREQSGGDHHLVRRSYKDVAVSAVHAATLSGDQRKNDGFPPRELASSAPAVADNSNHQEAHSETLHNALDKTRSGAGNHQVGGGEKNRPEHHPTSVETRVCTKNPVRNNNPIHVTKQSRPGENISDRRSDSTTLNLQNKVDMLLTKHRGTTSTLATEKDMDLPLHAPKVEPLNIANIKNPEVKQWISSLGEKTKMRKRQKTNARKEDIATLLQANIIERCTKEQIRVTGSLFSVVEKLKNRRRAIYWPKALNSAVEHLKPNVDLTDPIEHARVEKNIFAATFDLKASFYQVELPEKTREMFGIICECGCFRFRRLPMGFSISPFLMNEITKQAAEAAQTDEVKADVYIDNIRLTSNDRQKLEESCKKLRSHCKNNNITLNDEPGNDVHQQGDFLGLSYNYKVGTVKLGRKTFEKLQLTKIPKRAPRREYLEIFGLILFATRALKIHPASFYDQIKFIRKKCCTGELDDEVEIWPSVVKGFESWIEVLKMNKPTRHEIGEPHSPDAILFTDASVIGWGAVLLCGPNVFSTAGRWSSPIDCSQICEFEAKAIAVAVERFCNILQNAKTITIRTDNTATMHTLKKGTAREFELNGAIAECARAFKNCSPNAAIFVSHVSTLVNPADPLSRGKPIEQQQLSAVRAQGAVGSGELLRVFTQ